MKSVSILGCGWLGLPLASSLAHTGYRVKGSSTRKEKLEYLKNAGIEAYHVALSPHWEGESASHFLDSPYIILNIPPHTRKQGKGADFHPQQIQHFLEAGKPLWSKETRLVYVSATSIYPNLNRQVDESEALSEENTGNLALYRAENQLRDFFQDRLTILRSGGLMGYDRIPLKYFAGKTNLKNGNHPVNYVHRDDVIGIILRILEKNAWGKTWNVVAPRHPQKVEVLAANAHTTSYPAAHFVEESDKNFKLVSGDKLRAELFYEYKYPDPLSFRYTE